MTFDVRYTAEARADIKRLVSFLAAKDTAAARRAVGAIGDAIKLLEQFPFSCRKAAPDDPLLRELLISFGNFGYLALFRIDDDRTISILAIRHQLEDDFY